MKESVQTPIKLGPLALLLAVISICLATLAVLTFSTAKADRRLAERYAETVKARYALEIRGQELLAQADPLPDGETDEAGVRRITLTEGRSELHIGLADEEGGSRVVEWRHMRQWEEDTSIGNLWNGK